MQPRWPSPRIRKAAKQYLEDTGIPVEEAAGTKSPALIELFLIVSGYLEGEPTLVKPRDN